MDDIYTDDVRFEPYWWEEAPRIEAPPVELPAEADVAIIGSGYAGLSAALPLLRGGRSVLVLEAEQPGIGASSRNGGAVGATLRISFSRMIEMFGLEKAEDYYRGVRAARQHLGDLIEQEGIDCGFARVGRFIGAHVPADYETLARDYEALEKHIGADAAMVPRSEQHRYIGSDHYHGGRVLNGDGNLHPALLHQGLLDRVKAAGGVIAAHTRVDGFARDGDRFALRIGARTVSARDVIVATNGYTGPVSGWLRRRLIPLQSQIIATEPLDKAQVERLIPAQRQIGDTCRLHHYYRTSPDGTRILFGGRAGATEVDDPRRSGPHLYRRLVALFPELAEVRISHSWAGFIAYTFDHLPHIARRDGVHYVAGFCGSGVAMANYLGHKTGLRILGSPDAETVFGAAHPTRLLYTGNPWFLPPIVWYLDWRDRMRF